MRVLIIMKDYLNNIFYNRGKTFSIIFDIISISSLNFSNEERKIFDLPNDWTHSMQVPIAVID